MKPVIIIIVIALWVAVALSLAILIFTPFGEFGNVGKQQSLDSLQEQVNRCNALSDDGGLQSPRIECVFGLLPQVVEFCEKYPNSDVLYGNCVDFLDVGDKMKNSASFLDSRFP